MTYNKNLHPSPRKPNPPVTQPQFSMPKDSSDRESTSSPFMHSYCYSHRLPSAPELELELAHSALATEQNRLGSFCAPCPASQETALSTAGTCRPIARPYASAVSCALGLAGPCCFHAVLAALSASYKPSSLALGADIGCTLLRRVCLAGRRFSVTFVVAR